MHFDDLFLVGDVVPVPVSLPALSDNLDQHSTCWAYWDVRDAALIRFHINFSFLIFDQLLIQRLDIHTGVLHWLVGVATGNFNGQTRYGSRRWRFRRRSFFLRSLSQER